MVQSPSFGLDLALLNTTSLVFSYLGADVRSATIDKFLRKVQPEAPLRTIMVWYDCSKSAAAERDWGKERILKFTCSHKPFRDRLMYEFEGLYWIRRDVKEEDIALYKMYEVL